MSRRKMLQAGAAALAIGLFFWADRTGRIPSMRALDPTWQADRLQMAPGLIVYLLFGVYWAVAATNRSADQTPESPWSVILHRALVGASLLLIVLPVPGLMARLLPPSPVFIAGGLAVELAGAWLAVSARRHLGSNWSAEIRIAEGHKLVRSGPYGRLRHPIYAGVLLMYFGLSLASGRLHSLVGLGLAALTYLRKAWLEERLLQQTFGAEFTEYRHASWALIPPFFF
jgi:protein-S-isoprenylcysteine O-methyltransferase Ste14